MVLESMINPKNAEDKPSHVFVIAILYTLIGMFFAYYLFPSQASILSVAMITIIFVPFFQKMFLLEEKKEDQAARGKQSNLFSRHARSIFVYSAFFLGVIVAMSFVFVFFGNNSQLFSLQTDTLKSFSTGSAVGSGDFWKFFFNNSQVMLMMFVLSILFGAGAVLVLAWNASVIAVYAGLFINTLTGPPTVAYFIGLPAGLATIALHGVPEVLAYFVGGLAGGILSVGIIREKFNSRNFNMIFADSIKFLIMAEALIIVAALIESL